MTLKDVEKSKEEMIDFNKHHKEILEKLFNNLGAKK